MDRDGDVELLLSCANGRTARHIVPGIDIESTETTFKMEYDGDARVLRFKVWTEGQPEPRGVTLDECDNPGGTHLGLGSNVAGDNRAHIYFRDVEVLAGVEREVCNGVDDDCDGEIDEELFVAQTFEDGEIGGWEPLAEQDVFEVANGGAEGTARALHFGDGDNNGGAAVLTLFDDDVPVRSVSFSMRAELDSVTAGLRMKNGDGADVVGIEYDSRLAGAALYDRRLNGQDDNRRLLVATDPAGFHRFRVVFDWDAQEFDIYVDGVRREEGLPMADIVNPAQGANLAGITRLSLSEGRGNELYIDELRVQLADTDEICGDDIDNNCDGEADEPIECDPCEVAAAPDGRRFAFCSGGVSWGEAAVRCAARDMALADVEDAARNAWLTQELGARFGAPNVWIGLRRVDDQLQWPDGRAPDYQTWQEGEPNANGPCVILRGDPAGTWADTECANVGFDGFVCAAPASGDCPPHMVLVGEICIDAVLQQADFKADGVEACEARGAHICEWDELDAAFGAGHRPEGYGNDDASGKLATTGGTGCCCPCGSPLDEGGSAQTYWDDAREICECWSQRYPNYLCCAPAECLPEPELCNGEDDDCDGEVDEGCLECPDDIDGGVAFYGLDGNATDALGAHDARQEGPVATADRRGDAGRALLFDGVADRVVIPASDDFILRDRITVSAWIRWEGGQQATYIVFMACSACDEVSHDPYILGMDGGRLWFQVQAADGERQVQLFGPPPEVGVWQHVAGTFDLEGGDEAARLFVDGEQVAAGAFAIQAGSMGEGDITIGARRAVVDRFDFGFHGAIDDVGIWDRALTPEEIADLADTPFELCNGRDDDCDDEVDEQGGFSDDFDREVIAPWVVNSGEWRSDNAQPPRALFVGNNGGTAVREVGHLHAFDFVSRWRGSTALSNPAFVVNTAADVEVSGPWAAGLGVGVVAIEQSDQLRVLCGDSAALVDVAGLRARHDADMMVRLRYDQSRLSVRFWERGAAEPDDWDYEQADCGDTPDDRQHIALGMNGAVAAMRFYDVEVRGLGCDAPLELRLGDDPQQLGSSEHPRVSEVFELPLVAGGYLEDDVLLHLPLACDGANCAQHVDGRTGIAAVVQGAAATPATGPMELDGAIHLDGATELRVAHDARLDVGAGPFSVGIWFRVDPGDTGDDNSLVNAPSNHVIYAVSLTADCPDALASPCVHSTVRDADHVGGLALWGGHPAGGNGLDDGAWHHVWLVRTDDAFRFFVDGSLTGSASAEGYGNLYPGEGLKLGGQFSLTGDLADLVLHSRALSPAEIAAYYEARRPWGTRTVQRSQPDWDDLRVTEDGRPIEFEVIGARPLATQPADLDEHVVGYWPLDGNVEPMTASDGNSIVGAPVSARGRFGDPGGALAFDGDDDAADVWADRAYRFGEQYTVEFWARTTSAEGSRRLVASSSGVVAPSSGMGFGLFNGRIRFVGATWAAGGDGEVEFDGTRQVADGRWHHLAGVRDGDQFVLYVDGVVDGQAQHAGVPADYDGGNPFGLMSMHHFFDGVRYNPIAGQLDELVIHDVARSADYIYKRAHPLPRARFFVRTSAEPDGDRYPYASYALHHGDPLAQRAFQRRPDGLLSPRNGYVAWWRFDEARPGVFVDASTNRLHVDHAERGSLSHVGAPHVAGIDVDDRAGGDIDDDQLGLAQFTIETSTQVDADGPNDQRLYQRSGGGQQVDVSYRLQLVDGRLRASFESGPPGGPVADCTVGHELADPEQWHHTAFTYDGTDARLWLDHEDRNSAACGAPYAGDATFTFGGEAAGEGDFLDGRMDFVRIMNRAVEAPAMVQASRTLWSLVAP